MPFVYKRYLLFCQESGQSEDGAVQDSAQESESGSVAASVMSLHRHHLEEKLHELQDKRLQMEDLMKDLQALRREQKHHLNQLHLNNGTYIIWISCVHDDSLQYIE